MCKDVSGLTLTASTTENGYNAENVREADLERAWKSSDNATLTSPAGDEWLKIQGAVNTWLGATSATCYFALAYDARGSDQNVIKLQTNSVDDGSFDDTLTTQATHTLDKTGVGCWFASFSCPQKQYYRLVQLGTDRTGTAGVTVKILYWAMYDAASVMVLSSSYPGISPAPWNIRQMYNVGAGPAAGGLPRFARYAEPSQRFQIPFSPASPTLWAHFRDRFYSIGGPERPIFVQFEGLKNAAKADFFLCRLVSDNWSAKLVPVGQYAMPDIEMETERWK